MSDNSPVLRILAILKPYLDEKMATWAAQPVKGLTRTATLPVTNTGKLNVRALVVDLASHGLKPDDEQHLYKKPEIKDAVNAVATLQGIKGIGYTATTEDATEQKISMLSSANKKLANTLSEKLSELVTLREENHKLRLRIGKIRSDSTD